MSRSSHLLLYIPPATTTATSEKVVHQQQMPTATTTQMCLVNTGRHEKNKCFFSGRTIKRGLLYHKEEKKKNQIKNGLTTHKTLRSRGGGLYPDFCGSTTKKTLFLYVFPKVARTKSFLKITTNTTTVMHHTLHQHQQQQKQQTAGETFLM